MPGAEDQHRRPVGARRFLRFDFHRQQRGIEPLQRQGDMPAAALPDCRPERDRKPVASLAGDEHRPCPLDPCHLQRPAADGARRCFTCDDHRRARFARGGAECTGNADENGRCAGVEQRAERGGEGGHVGTLAEGQ
jgi:hypothetical protein